MKGWVFNVQRFSLHDGPGIRTTVFLKGCPLRCLWCHNPEGLSAQPQVRLSPALCLHCGRCVAACESGGHEVTPEAHILHLEPCTRCGECMDVCVAGALEMVGSKMSVAEVMAVVRRDVPFYDQSGGGMTLSGGEPLAQPGFSRQLLAAARSEEINTAIESALYAPWSSVAALLPLVDLWMVDLKHTDDARHLELTGVSNRRIVASIRRLAGTAASMVLRVPWVPGANVERGIGNRESGIAAPEEGPCAPRLQTHSGSDSTPQPASEGDSRFPIPDSLLSGLLSLERSLPRVIPIEFMPYHRLGGGKLEGLGMQPTMPDDIPAANPDDIAPWIERLAAEGIPASVR